jgi:hypothetical protein
MKNFTDVERRAIIDSLLEVSMNGVLPRGAYAAFGRRLRCHRATVRSIWLRYRQAVAEGNIGTSWQGRKAQNSGRPRVDREFLRDAVQRVPWEDRQNSHRTAAAAGVSRHLVRSMVFEGALTSRSSRIHPALTSENKLQRIEWVMSFIDENKHKFESMMDVVHVDEKWFNADKDKRSYLVLDGEERPQRSWRSKRFIPQTMFLAAVARPR